MKEAFLVVLGAAALGLSGCDGCNKPPPAADAAADAMAAPDAAASGASRSPFMKGDAGVVIPWAAIPSATAPLLPNMSIPDRFQVEKSSRPKDLKINVESVYAALTKAGLHVVDEKQHLAQTFGARYCIGARVLKGPGDNDPTVMQTSVCEFISNEVATMSQTYSTDALKQIPNRVVRAKAQTTLTVRGESDAPEIKALMDKALATYDAL